MALMTLMTEIKSMESTLTSVLIESVLKLIRLTDSNVFILVESERDGRRFGGNPSLCERFRGGGLRATCGDVELDVSMGVSSLFTKTVTGGNEQRFVPGQRVVTDQRGIASQRIAADQHFVADQRLVETAVADQRVAAILNPPSIGPDCQSLVPTSSQPTHNSQILKIESSSFYSITEDSGGNILSERKRKAMEEDSIAKRPKSESLEFQILDERSVIRVSR